MTIYSVIVSKNETPEVKKDVEWDQKNSGTTTTQQDLQIKFDNLKTKYNAQELPEKESSIGPFFSYGFFKVDKGVCKHGKEVTIEYNQIEGMGCGSN